EEEEDTLTGTIDKEENHPIRNVAIATAGYQLAFWLAESEGCPPESGAECRVSWAEVLTRRGSTEKRQGGRMVVKGGRQRERERHTGEPSTQARSTWPTHIAPTRFLSLADNCTISLRKHIRDCVKMHLRVGKRSFFRDFKISFNHFLITRKNVLSWINGNDINDGKRDLAKWRQSRRHDKKEENARKRRETKDKDEREHKPPTELAVSDKGISTPLVRSLRSTQIETPPRLLTVSSFRALRFFPTYMIILSRKKILRPLCYVIDFCARKTNDRKTENRIRTIFKRRCFRRLLQIMKWIAPEGNSHISRTIISRVIGATAEFPQSSWCNHTFFTLVELYRRCVYATWTKTEEPRASLSTFFHVLITSGLRESGRVVWCKEHVITRSSAIDSSVPHRCLPRRSVRVEEIQRSPFCAINALFAQSIPPIYLLPLTRSYSPLYRVNQLNGEGWRNEGWLKQER
ncbi:hypothetical protein ALC53_09737, partial [Atta colombica]